MHVFGVHIAYHSLFDSSSPFRSVPDRSLCVCRAIRFDRIFVSFRFSTLRSDRNDKTFLFRIDILLFVYLSRAPLAGRRTINGSFTPCHNFHGRETEECKEAAEVAMCSQTLKKRTEGENNRCDANINEQFEHNKLFRFSR